MTNELFSSGGYNLEYFQVYNWGTFHQKIYTIRAANKASLLTGENGSGKTTLVDALLTLLVPNDKRFYNQSSGEAKKRDRSEESYVLGAYGSKLSDDENAVYSSVQLLRKKENTISILNGCFTNPFEGKSITLLQIRYFTNSNLQQLFAITEGKLSIEEINSLLSELNVEIIRDKKWKDLLCNARGTVFYPTFKQYVSAYARVFGFRSDKALTLFSQIVGLKVLGDINSFIKYNMLEEGSILSEFDKLQENYANLVHSYNVIQKTRVQIEKFKSVHETGSKYKEELLKREEVKSLIDTLPFWYMTNAGEFLSEKLSADTEKQERISRELSVLKQEIQRLDTEIEAINRSIAQDSNTIRLMEIENRIKELQEDKAQKQQRRDAFEQCLRGLELPFPHAEDNFIACQRKLGESHQKSFQEESELEEKIRQARNEQDALSQEKKQIRAELESLNNRDSNIPEHNVLIRDRICQALKIDEGDIPFAGELICVKEEERHWNNAIEKVLHNFALTLIVPGQFYKAVSAFVNENDMKGRVVYLKAEENIFDAETENIEFGSNSIGEKLNFKAGHPQCRWVQSYIKEHFSFLCTDDIEVYAAARKALTSSGLIKSDLRNEKDDRPGKNAKSNWVLGWNNKEKRNQLSRDYDDLSSRETELKAEEAVLQQEKASQRQIQNFCHDALQVKNWDEIDVESIVRKLDGAQKERALLLAENSSLAKLKEEAVQKKALKTEKESDAENLTKELGRIEQGISDCKKELESNSSQLDNLRQMIDLSNLDERLSFLQKNYPRLSKPKGLDELKNNRCSIDEDLKSKSSSLGRSLGGYESQLKNSMEEALHPSSKEIREKYGDWSLDFSDLRATLDYLDDFFATYKKLEKDDLPKYMGRFHEYLHTSLREDFTGFQRSIQNQQQEIKQAILSLNQDLKRIAYNKNPDTYLRLEYRVKNDSDIKEFNRLLKDAAPDAMLLAENNSQKEEEQFEKIQKLLRTLNENERFKKKVLDVRNWYQYGAQELFAQDDGQKQYYSDSSSLSGGQKTKLTYTIMAAAISYQFGIVANTESNASFRFIIIDEAFSKIDSKNSEQVMAIFNDLDIQVMVVTPNDKINVVEDFISSVHLVDKTNTDDSRLFYMGIEEYKEKKK